MKTKLWLFLVSFALVYSACQKEAEFSNTLNGGSSRDILHLGDDYVFTVDENGVAQTDLIAGQNQIVGKVKVELTDDDIIVTYKTNPGWFLTETHLHIAKDEDALFAQITNRAGNPRIGNFDYGTEEDIFQTSWEITIPKEEIKPPSENGCYAIAAHAVVAGVSEEGGYFDLNAFALSLPETAAIEVTWPDFVNNPGAVSYFPNVNVTEADFLNGDFPGWCIQADFNIFEDEVYNALVYSYNEQVPGYDAEFLKKVNWIINKKFVENYGYTYADVQIAIWLLRHDIDIYTNENWISDLDGLGGQVMRRAYLGRLGSGYFEDNIKAILEGAASNYEDFVPACWDVIAVVFRTPDNIQDIIVEYPVPCDLVGDGHETAWGQGGLFGGNSWAMYFEICPQPETE